MLNEEGPCLGTYCGRCGLGGQYGVHKLIVGLLGAMPCPLGSVTRGTFPLNRECGRLIEQNRGQDGVEWVQMTIGTL